MLTEEQEAAASTDSSAVVVSAGAGSGKTTVLCERIERLISSGVEPSTIIAITFTRRAALELKSRLSDARVICGTFHSIFMRHLLQSGDNRDLLEEHEADALLDECARRCGLLVGSRWVKKGRKFYKDMIRKYRVGTLKESHQVVQQYFSELSLRGCIDYDGLLCYGRKEASQGGFSLIKHLIVDESQDNEPLQWQFVRLMKKQGTNVMVVGDIGQSLYSFRGADPGQFKKVCNNWHHLQLTKTFRFGQRLADAANRTGASPLKLRSDTDATSLHETEATPHRTVYSLLQSGEDPNDIAVLCRYNSQVTEVIQNLEEMGIQVARIRRVEKTQEHWLLAYLANPSATNRKRVKMSWKGDAPKPLLWIVSSSSDSVSAELTRNWIAENDIQKIDDVHGHIRIDGIIGEFGGYSLADYLADTAGETFAAMSGGVTVGTMHWSKGGEWPIVILPQLQRKVWPRGNNIGDEEWRVFYVAMTRAQDRLFLQWDPGAERSEMVDVAMGARRKS